MFLTEIYHFPMREVHAVILAAGKSTRMKSLKTKLLLEIGGKPIIKRVVEACEIPAISRIYLIVGYSADEIIQTLSSVSNLGQRKP